MTAGAIAGLLIDRSCEKDGPEIVIILPRQYSGWLEQSTMDAIRSQLVIVLALLLALAATWLWMPLSEWASIERLAGWIDVMHGSPLLPAVVMGGTYFVAGLLMAPVTLLVRATAILFSPLAGTLYALAGCLLSGLATYAIGAKLGRNTIRKLTEKRTARLNRRLAENGIFDVAIIRNLTVAPFSIVNLMAGASRIKMKDYLFGTAIGMLPGIIGVVFFSDRLLNAVRNPSWFNISISAGVAVLIGLVSWWIHRRLRQRKPTGQPRVGLREGDAGFGHQIPQPLSPAHLFPRLPECPAASNWRQQR